MGLYFPSEESHATDFNHYTTENDPSSIKNTLRDLRVDFQWNHTYEVKLYMRVLQ
jgi:hypothetical protein